MKQLPKWNLKCPASKRKNEQMGLYQTEKISAQQKNQTKPKQKTRH
jgi:hypothetical protein